MRFAESIGMALCKTALTAEDDFTKEVNQIFDGLQQMPNDLTVGTLDCWSDFQILPHRLCYFPTSRRSTAMLSIQKTVIELGISVTIENLMMVKTPRRNLIQAERRLGQSFLDLRLPHRVVSRLERPPA